MNPILYESTENTFSTNGVGTLSDCVSCVVTENRNGSYELEMEYPIDGIHFSDIKLRSIITAKPNPTSEIQPFRVYEITRPISGTVTVYAQHISYDLSGIPVSPFTASSAVQAMTLLKSQSVVSNPFTFWTDKSTAATMTVEAPSSIRSLLGGNEGSVLDCYGGEYEFDGYTVRLHSARGENRGVSIRYGKNLTDINQEENCSSVYTGVYPYWLGQDGTLVQLYEKVINAPGTYDFVRIFPLDLTSEWQEAPTKEQLRDRAESYMESNNIGVPTVSITVSFVQLEQTEEYKDIALLERVSLCDTVNVEFEQLGVSATAECVKTVYDVLLERYNSVELGDAKTGITDSIMDSNDVEKLVKDSNASLEHEINAAIDNATSQITGNLGGYVVLHSSTGGKEPDEILIMDTPNINTATKVWRWNKAGLGYSSNGYNGPFGTAITQDGQIVADYVATGTLAANLIKAGLLSDLSGKNFWNMETGELSISASTTVGGQTINNIADNAASSAINSYDNSLDQQEVFNKLTNNGKVVGIFLSDGQLYVSASIIQTGTLDASKITVENLSASGVDLSGEFTATSGSYSAKFWAAMMDIVAGSYRRATLGSTGGTVSSSSGILQLFSGPTDSDGNLTASSSRYSAITASLLEIGRNMSGTYSGEIRTGSFRSNDVYVSGLFRPNDSQNALYCDWVPVQDMNGNQQWVLAGFTTPQG